MKATPAIGNRAVEAAPVSASTSSSMAGPAGSTMVPLAVPSWSSEPPSVTW